MQAYQTHSGTSKTVLVYPGGSPSACHSTFLRFIVSLSVISESSSASISCSMTSSQILYQEMNTSYVKNATPYPNECILLVFTHCIYALVGDCPHPTFHCKDISTHEQFIILGLLLILTIFPLSPAKSFLVFFSFASVTLSK